MSQITRREGGTLGVSAALKALAATLVMALAVLVSLPQSALAEGGEFTINGAPVTLDAGETWADRFVKAVGDTSTTTIQLQEDLTIPAEKDYFFVGPSNLAIDLNGHTLTMDTRSRFVINDGKSLSIENGNLTGTNRAEQVVEFNNGKLTLNKVTATSEGHRLVGMANNDSNTLTITNSTIKDSGSETSEAAISSYGGTVTITSSTFTGNKASNGGTIRKEGGTITVTGSTFTGNAATGNGGALWLSNTTATVTDSTITGNSANEGAGIFADTTTLTVSNATSGSISGNTASSVAGGIRANNSTVNLNGAKVESNTATNDGGGIYATGGSTISLDGGSVTKNTATKGNGGGIYATGSSLTLSNKAKVNENTAANNAGGILFDPGNDAKTLAIPAGTEVSGNTAGGEGGGINSAGQATVEVQGTVSGNSAKTGGGINAGGDSVAVTISGTVSNNSATEVGGGVRMYGGKKLTVQDGASITGNTAGTQGGGVFAWSVDMDVTGGSISNNTATAEGGGIYFNQNDSKDHTLNVSAGSITGNKALAGLDANGNRTTGNGGGIFAYGTNASAKVNVTGTATISNNVAGFQDTSADKTGYGQGGGINLGGNVRENKSVLTIDGAGVKISGNQAWSSTWSTGGGGISVGGDNAKLILKNGSIDGNFAYGSGGGILTSGDYFEMSGGSVTNNVADLHEGGGITMTGGTNLDRNTGTIYAGAITGNKTGYKQDGSAETDYVDWGGGGIFVSDKATLKVPVETLITSNDAGGFGGGMAGCSTARIYLLDKAAVYGNSAAGTNASGAGSVKHEDHQYALDNKTFMDSGYQDFFSAFSAYVTETMPGGKEGWSGSVDGKAVAKGTDPIISSSAVGLTASGTSGYNGWKLVIKDNSSRTHGGGILVNGTAVFGDADQITIGTSVELNALKQLLGDDDADLSSALVTTAEDGTQTGHATFAISTSADKADTSAYFSTGQVKNADGSYQVLFDRRPTFDSTNCTEKSSNYDKASKTWTFTYYVFETGADAWMSADSTMYKVDLNVKKVAERQRIGNDLAADYQDTDDAINDSQKTFTKYRYEIDWDKSTVSKSTDGGKTFSALAADTDYTKTKTDEAHSDQLNLYAGDAKTFTNTLKKTTSLTVTKAWDDKSDADGLRPSDKDFLASLKLYGDDQVAEATPALAKNDDGTYTVRYADLPYGTVTTADDGTVTVTPITYRVVEELAEGSAYTVAYANTGTYADKTDSAYDGGTITNTHEVKKPAAKPTAKPTSPLAAVVPAAQPAAKTPQTSDPLAMLPSLIASLAGMGTGVAGVGLALRRRGRK